jgi:hypothetical protein
VLEGHVEHEVVLSDRNEVWSWLRANPTVKISVAPFNDLLVVRITRYEKNPYHDDASDITYGHASHRNFDEALEVAFLQAKSRLMEISP